MKKASHRVNHLGGDVHRLSNLNWQPASQSFGHHNDEVLVVGGESEQLCTAEGSTLELAA
jgi:hypothetical protein